MKDIEHCNLLQNSEADREDSDDFSTLPQKPGSRKYFAVSFIAGAATAIILLALALYHPHEKPNVAKAGLTLHGCGTSFDQAREIGCHFDVMSAGFVPPDCYDDELSKHFMPSLTFSWYLDVEAKHEVQFENVGDAKFDELAQYDHLWASSEFHRQHCIFTWQKLVRALIDGRPIDQKALNWNHTLHCADVLLGEGRKNSIVGTDAEWNMQACGPYHNGR